MNPALIELAAILLQFEVERQQKAAADGDVSEATPKAAAEAPVSQANRRLNSTSQRRAAQKGG